MTSSPTGSKATGRRAYRARLLANLFERAGYRVKAPCLKCARPFVVERAGAQNSAGQCDCGEPTAVIVYLTIRQPGTPRARLTPAAMCEVCAIDELLSSLQRKIG